MNIKILNKAVYTYSIFAIFCTALLTTISTAAQADVSPPRIKIETKPGKKVPFSINIKNKNKERRSYQISYSHYTQDTDGYQNEVKVTSDEQKGPWDWIKLDNQIKPGVRFNIESKESLALSGIIEVPRRHSKSIGFYNIMVNVTEFAARQRESGVTLNYASASIIELTVTGPKRRPKYLIENIDINLDKEAQSSQVSLEFTNQTPYKGRLFLEMQLRLNKRLIAKIPLLTNEADNSNRLYSSIFPKNLVKLTGQTDKTLPPGEYDMRISGKFKDTRLRTFKESITIGTEGTPIAEEAPAEQTAAN